MGLATRGERLLQKEVMEREELRRLMGRPLAGAASQRWKNGSGRSRK